MCTRLFLIDILDADFLHLPLKSRILLQCALIQADLSDVITLSFDSTRQRIVSIGVQPIYLSSSDLCDSLSEETVLVDRFNTTVRLIEPVEGPV